MNTFLLSIILLSLGLTQTVFALENAKDKDAKQHHFLKLFDRNQDDSVSETEFTTTMQERYKTMDSDKNGTVSVEELKQYSEQRHKKKQQKKFDKVDSDKDGLISKQEFVDYALKRAHQRFSNLDKNQDGKISKAENVNNKHDKKKRHLLKKMDTNEDGAITPEEHSAISHQWFIKLDKNNDHVVSKDELKGHWHK